MIRRFELSDMDQIIKIWLDASIQAHGFIEKDFWVSRVFDMRNNYIPASETYVFDDGETVCGFFSLNGDTLAALFVAPELQGGGIGRQLMEKAKQLRSELNLVVYKENPSGIRFYHKGGFKKVKQQVDRYTGHPEVVMNWKSETMYKLYNYQASGNCYKIRLLMRQLDIPFESIPVDILNKETRTPSFLEKNPNGRVPVLQVNDKYLPESNAALWYLAKGTGFIPDDDFRQSQVLQWMFFEQYSHEPNISTVRYWVSILQAEHEYREQINIKKRAGYAALDVMEAHLSANDFFVADKYTIADIALYAYTHVAHEGGFDLAGYGNIRRWMAAVESQPNYVTMDNS